MFRFVRNTMLLFATGCFLFPSMLLFAQEMPTDY
jgi:hypothetical protein